jgi:hypothetical protein
MTDVAETTRSSSGEPHWLERGVLTVPNGMALAAVRCSGARSRAERACSRSRWGTALSLSFLLAFVACLGGGGLR